MPLILGIEPDRNQARRVAGLAPHHIDAEIVVVSTIDEALAWLDTHVPDLVLTPLLLSAKDDAALTTRLREVDGRGTELQTLVIPVLAAESEAAPSEERPGGLFTRMRRQKASAKTAGCAPAVFAEQIREYLARSDAERRDRQEAESPTSWAAAATASAPMLGELLPMQNHAPIAWVDPGVMPDVSNAEPVDVAETVTLEPVGMVEAAPADEVQPEPVETAGVLPAHVPEPVEIVTAPEPEASPVPADLEIEPMSTPPETLEPQPSAEWEDLEAFLEDLQLDEPGAAAQPVASAGESEPAVIELPSPDELMQSADVELSAAAAREQQQPRKRQTRLPKARPKAARAQTGTSERPGSRSKKRRSPERPMQDEWGLYDPEQCGFAALLERLEELTEIERTDTGPRRRSAIMRQ